MILMAFWKLHFMLSVLLPTELSKVQQSNLNFYLLCRYHLSEMSNLLSNFLTKFPSFYFYLHRNIAKNGRDTKDIKFPHSFTNIPTQVSRLNTSDRWVNSCQVSLWFVVSKAASKLNLLISSSNILTQLRRRFLSSQVHLDLISPSTFLGLFKNIVTGPATRRIRTKRCLKSFEIYDRDKMSVQFCFCLFYTSTLINAINSNCLARDTRLEIKRLLSLSPCII